MSNLSPDEFAAGLLKIQEELGVKMPNGEPFRGPWVFRDFAGGTTIYRPDDYVQRVGSSGGIAVVMMSKPQIQFKEHQYQTSDPETVLFLRNHKPRFGGLGRQYIEVTHIDEAEKMAESKKPTGPQLIKKWGRLKSEALQALGQRNVTTDFPKPPNWLDIVHRALEYKFEFEWEEGKMPATVVEAEKSVAESVDELVT